MSLEVFTNPENVEELEKLLDYRHDIPIMPIDVLDLNEYRGDIKTFKGSKIIWFAFQFNENDNPEHNMLELRLAYKHMNDKIRDLVKNGVSNPYVILSGDTLVEMVPVRTVFNTEKKTYTVQWAGTVINNEGS